MNEKIDNFLPVGVDDQHVTTTDSNVTDCVTSLNNDVHNEFDVLYDNQHVSVSNTHDIPYLGAQEIDATKLLTNVDSLDKFQFTFDTGANSNEPIDGTTNDNDDVVPIVPPSLIPVVGTVFQSIGHGIDMYKKYAESAGFDVRRSTEIKFRDKTVRIKYVVCHRHGLPNKRSVDTTKPANNRKVLRNSNFKVTGCKTMVRFCRVGVTSSFKLYYFNPNHNHPLYDENDKILSRSKRQMKFSDKMLIHRASNVNIGAAKAHQLQVCLKGGYDEVGSTRVDYKNYKRDYDSFVGDGDVQMILNMFKERVANDTNFAFEFKVEEGKLQGIFWADELSRFNYTEFGHVISFDATYRSNK